jgi:hypothetical protein
LTSAIQSTFATNNTKNAFRHPEALRAIQHHQLMSQYNLSPEQIDKLPWRYVQLLRLCIQEEGKQVRESGKKQQFYSEIGVTPASGARF